MLGEGTVMKVWDAFLTFDAYTRTRNAGAFDGSLSHYAKSSAHGGLVRIGKVVWTEGEQSKRGKFGAQRMFPVDPAVKETGERQMVAHVKLSNLTGVAPRMYFEDTYSAVGYVTVGYLGAHLDNTLTNTISHLLDHEGDPGRRALTFDELERFFDAADARVEAIVRARRKGALAALRNAQMFKTIYAFGLRRSECIGLDVADLRSNPVAPGFGSFGAVYVRHGKGSRGTGPKRRTVLTLPEFDWVVDGLTHWVDQGRPRVVGDWETDILWPTERRTRIGGRYLNDRFAELRDEAGLPEELVLHSLRHTYVTNLIEWGYSEKFVQDQVGHTFASTTAIYTSVGDDYKNRVLADALKRNTEDRDGD